MGGDIEEGWFAEWIGLNAASFAVYNGKKYFADSLTKNVRELDIDGRYDDDDLPYTVHAKTKWFNEKYTEDGKLANLPHRQGEMRYLWLDMWLRKLDKVDIIINYDEGGRLGSFTRQIKGTDDGVIFPSTSTAFGPNPFGIKAFSQVGTDDIDQRGRYRKYIPLSNFRSKKFYNFQIEIKSSVAGQNWAITKLAPFVVALKKEFSIKHIS